MYKIYFMYLCINIYLIYIIYNKILYKYHIYHIYIYIERDVKCLCILCTAIQNVSLVYEFGWSHININTRISQAHSSCFFPGPHVSNSLHIMASLSSITQVFSTGSIWFHLRRASLPCCSTDDHRTLPGTVVHSGALPQFLRPCQNSGDGHSSEAGMRYP